MFMYNADTAFGLNKSCALIHGSTYTINFSGHNITATWARCNDQYYNCQKPISLHCTVSDYHAFILFNIIGILICFSFDITVII